MEFLASTNWRVFFLAIWYSWIISICWFDFFLNIHYLSLKIKCTGFTCSSYHTPSLVLFITSCCGRCRDLLQHPRSVGRDHPSGQHTVKTCAAADNACSSTHDKTETVLELIAHNTERAGLYCIWCEQVTCRTGVMHCICTCNWKF